MFYNIYQVEKQNASEIHDLLNDECVNFQVILDQDTWIFNDGS